MCKSILTVLLSLSFVACTSGAAKDAPNADAKTAGKTGIFSSSDRSLASGTRVNATIENALSSRTNKPGETLRATVSSDVKNARGTVVIPAGSTVQLTIEQLEPGSDQVRPEGRLNLLVNSVTVKGQVYPVSASLSPVPHSMKGRGITTDEAARVGAGTAIGAIVGQAIGKNTKSTVIGGAVGTVAGGAVAVRYAYRDVIVSPGTPIVFTLERSLNVSAR
jgi:hypothetical protein